MTFGLIGASGYIAERHYKAIKENGGEVTHIYDIHNSAGVIDRYFPKAIFCNSEQEFFETKTDYKVICTPNYLHQGHISMSLYSGSKVICEKPLTLNPVMFNDNVNCILQLRHNPIVEELKKLEGVAFLDYSVVRGDWYWKSWKGDNEKSGGIAFNIGIHLFDLLIYCYGGVKDWKVRFNMQEFIDGTLFFENIEVNFHLEIKREGTPWRDIIHGDKTYNLSKGFENAHTISYKHILEGNGWKAKDCIEAIELVNNLIK